MFKYFTVAHLKTTYNLDVTDVKKMKVGGFTHYLFLAWASRKPFVARSDGPKISKYCIHGHFQ